MPRGGAPKLRNRRVPPPPGRRRGQGVITGLAARRPAALLKRVGTLNRAATNQVMEDILMEDILESTTTQGHVWALIVASDIGLKPHCRLLTLLASIHSLLLNRTVTELSNERVFRLRLVRLTNSPFSC